MKNLLKFAAGSTLICLMTAAAALIRGKLAAILLGTVGVGLFGQVDTFYRGLVQVCILSTSAGVTRCIAELHGAGDTSAIRRAFWSITAFSVGLAILVATCMLIFSARVSGVVLGDRRYGPLLAIVAWGLPLQALSDIVMGMLIGLRDLRAQILITAAYTVGGAALYSILIVRFGLAGAVYGSLATAGCASAASLFFLQRHRILNLRRSRGERFFDRTLLRAILAIGLTGGVMAITDRAVLLVFRTILIRRFGLAANGLFQVVYSLSQLNIALAFGFVSTYLVPTLSGMRDAERRHAEFDSAFRLTAIIATLGSAVMILYGRFIIMATYSSAFLGAAPLLRYQAMGDFFRALNLLLSATIFAVHGWKPWFAIGMSFYAVYILFFRLLLPSAGFSAISIAYLLAQGMSCCLAAVLFARYTGIGSLRTSRLFWRSVGLLFTAGILVSWGNFALTYCLGGVAVLLWASLVLTSTEYQRIWLYLSSPATLLAGGNR